MQIKYGLPADSWPTAELLARMRGLRPQALARGTGVRSSASITTRQNLPND